jgi:ferredoxin
MPRVRFHPNQREVEVAAGESLLRAAILAGVHVNATCGGSGVCGKCRVVVESGAVASEPSRN